MQLFLISGAVLYVIEMYQFYQWWGMSGLLSGIIFGPVLCELFPFIYWYKEEFPVFYFVLWGIGLIGLISSSLKNK